MVQVDKVLERNTVGAPRVHGGQTGMRGLLCLLRAKSEVYLKVALASILAIVWTSFRSIRSPPRYSQ